jgi:hypothetical protein
MVHIVFWKVDWTSLQKMENIICAAFALRKCKDNFKLKEHSISNILLSVETYFLILQHPCNGCKDASTILTNLPIVIK